MLQQGFFDALPSALQADVAEKMRFIRALESRGLLTPEMYVGKRVLDWEAGLGGFSAAFYCLGAAEVTAIDSWVENDRFLPGVSRPESLTYARTSLLTLSKEHQTSTLHFDLIFSNTVTEHIDNLPECFDVIKSLLSDSGFYFNNHDNYYSPCGSHEHGFWFYGQANKIVFQGKKCWEHANCELSSSHRQELLETKPWTWNSTLNDARNPCDCVSCPYFKRGSEWAHLIYIDEFSTIFNDTSFLTRRPGSSLNKLTTFQLRQFLNEAGLKTLKFERNLCDNEPPETLIAAGFSACELRTTTTLWLCVRASSGQTQSLEISAAPATM